MEPDENGMFLCDKCKGEGRFLVPGKKLDNETYMAVFKTCDKCRGDGKLDWVEMATGKKKIEVGTYMDDLHMLLNDSDLDFDKLFDEEQMFDKPSPGKSIKLITGMKYEPK